MLPNITSNSVQNKSIWSPKPLQIEAPRCLGIQMPLLRPDLDVIFGHILPQNPGPTLFYHSRWFLPHWRPPEDKTPSTLKWHVRGFVEAPLGLFHTSGHTADGRLDQNIGQVRFEALQCRKTAHGGSDGSGADAHIVTHRPFRSFGRPFRASQQS